jgi:hypothetical protein
MRALGIVLAILALAAPAGARAQAPASGMLGVSITILAPVDVVAQAPAPAAAQAVPAPSAHPRRRHHALYHRPPQAHPAAAAPLVAGGTSEAPVPNENVGPPEAPPDTRTQIDPGTLHIHYPPLGNGYLPGSSPQDMANTQTPQVPGVTVKIPLQQGQPQTLPPPGQGP